MILKTCSFILVHVYLKIFNKFNPYKVFQDGEIILFFGEEKNIKKVFNS